MVLRSRFHVNVLRGEEGWGGGHRNRRLQASRLWTWSCNFGPGSASAYRYFGYRQKIPEYSPRRLQHCPAGAAAAREFCGRQARSIGSLPPPSSSIGFCIFVQDRDETPPPPPVNRSHLYPSPGTRARLDLREGGGGGGETRRRKQSIASRHFTFALSVLPAVIAITIFGELECFAQRLG